MERCFGAPDLSLQLFVGTQVRLGAAQSKTQSSMDDHLRYTSAKRVVEPDALKGQCRSINLLNLIQPPFKGLQCLIGLFCRSMSKQASIRGLQCGTWLDQRYSATPSPVTATLQAP